ncbi:MAG: alanine--glyoxylate aminotransferase family protein [Acidobacteriota bacterium]
MSTTPKSSTASSIDPAKLHSREPVRYFVPGPTYVLESVRQQMLRPVVPHRSPEFLDAYRRIAEALPQVFRSQRPAYVATGSSTLVMESAIVSLVPRRVLNLVGGAFAERWHEASRLAGKQADALRVPYGRAVDPELVRQALRRAGSRQTYDAVTVVHNETSSAVVNPVEEIARVVREESDALVLVDCVSSLASAPFEFDAWGVDVALAGVQKGLALPPGLTVFTFSAAAEARAEAMPHRGYYTDFLRYRDYHPKGTITTPAVPQIWAMDYQLQRVLAEGLEARWERSAAGQRACAQWAARHDFRLPAEPSARSATVTCLEPPPALQEAGLDGAEIVRRLAQRGFAVAGGYGEWKGRTFRIGHMGEVSPADLEALFAVLDEVVEEALEVTEAGVSS